MISFFSRRLRRFFVAFTGFFSAFSGRAARFAFLGGALLRASERRRRGGTSEGSGAAEA